MTLHEHYAGQDKHENSTQCQKCIQVEAEYRGPPDSVVPSSTLPILPFYLMPLLHLVLLGANFPSLQDSKTLKPSGYCTKAAINMGKSERGTYWPLNILG